METIENFITGWGMILFCITMLLLLSTVLILAFYVIARFAISEWKELFGKEEGEEDFELYRFSDNDFLDF